MHLGGTWGVSRAPSSLSQEVQAPEQGKSPATFQQAFCTQGLAILVTALVVMTGGQLDRAGKDGDGEVNINTEGRPLLQCSLSVLSAWCG
jgi:hypothetical protein